VGITAEELVVVGLVADVVEAVELDAGGFERAVLLWEEYIQELLVVPLLWERLYAEEFSVVVLL
jgi:hypothetical protein